MKRVIQSLLLLAGLLPRAHAVDSVVVFNEIHYHPATNETTSEWVELHNQMAIDIDLSAWELTGDIAFSFAEGTIILAGGYLVIASDPVALRAGAGITNVTGPFTGRLNNSQGTVRLRDRNRRLMDEVDYRDGGKWPVAPDGSGATLAKRDRNSTSGPAEHWTSSVVLDGTPGSRNFPENTGAPNSESQRRALIPINGLWRFNASGVDLGTSWRSSTFDDSTWRGRNNATLVSYWPLDGNATATVGTDGTMLGGPTAAPDRNGTADGALAFAGSLSQQRIEVPDGGGLNGASSGTISLWVKWAGTQDADCCTTYGAVFARQANGLFSDNIIALNTPNPTTARVVWCQSGAGAKLITGTSVVGTTWHHLAITFSPTSSTLYWDGNAQGSAAGPALHNNSSIPLSIGGWIGDGGGYSTSFIDDVAIWDQPLTALQIAQLAAQTATPLTFASPESAVYYAGDGRLVANDELRQTALPLGPTTYYFRSAFTFVEDPAQTALKLDLAVDDGAVLYLNGLELYRHNMPAGAISYGTPASTVVGNAPLLTEINVPASALVRGQNVLAVEVHQTGPADPGMVFGAALNAVLTPRATVDTRLLISRNDPWRYDASNTDLGTAWRSDSFNDAGWSSSAALFFSGSGAVDNVDPERLPTVGVSASSEYITDGRLATNAVNGNGLTGDAHVNTPAGTMWLSRGTLLLPNDLDPRITFDLGATSPVRWLKIWNYNEDLPNRPEFLARGVASANIMVGPTTASLTNLILGQLFNKAPGTFTDFAQLIDLGGVQTRYVRLDKLTNFPGGDSRLVGLSEVQFFRDPDLKRTSLPLGPVTYYFRRTFSFAGDPARSRLFLDTAIDDGAVFYLNGLEARRINMPGGTITHATRAINPVAHATYSGTIELATTPLRAGLNVLAVEVHQAAATGDPDMIFGANLWAEVDPASPESFSPGPLRFNEISAGDPASFQIELINQGSAPENTSGYIVRRTGLSPDASSTLAAHVLAPGQFLVLDQTTLGFSAAPGDKLFLLRPGALAVADSIEVHERPRSRFPDGVGEWFSQTTFFPGTGTPGSSNVVSLHDEVVFNEIFYHAPATLAVPAEFGTNTLLALTNVWRYEQSAVDLGNAWRQPGYDDRGWPAGRALLGVSATALSVPKNTDLTLGPTTFYFRTTFNYSGTPAALNLNLRYLVDDGAVFYLNGVEAHRFNMPAGAMVYTNNASAPQATPTLRAAVAISLTNLLLGPNVLAVEVHQAVVDGGDVAFAAELTAGSQVSSGSPYVPAQEEWVELHNRSTHPVGLAGWRLDEGIDFRFPANAQIPAGGYLVVAKDPTALLAKFPGIPVTGPYTNRLSHRGEQLVLKDAADNVANRVFYFDDGRWPDAPDAGGASLELRDPRADNTVGEAWAASDEQSRTSWRTYTYRGVASASAVGPDGQWKEFVMGLHGAGVVLLDDISVIETPPSGTPVQLIQNGSFDTGTNKWRIIGNHHGEVIDDPDQPGNKVLRLVATGSTEHMSNHGETTLANARDTVNGREYFISFRARWVSGSRQFHTRLYFNRLARTTLLDAPARHGTPGTRNSTFTNNIGPTYANLQHSPVVPAALAPTTVSVLAADPDGVAGLTLFWNVNGGAWSSSPMTAGALSPTGTVTYSATLIGRPASTVVQFYVEGVDGRGAVSWFPATGPRSRALYKVNDGRAATNGLHNFRLVTLTADGDQLHRTVNLMSNERVGCTVIYDEKEIFYDLGLRLKGSEHSRTTTERLGFNVAFTSEQRFRGVHNTVAIDRSESTGYGQREMLIHQTLNHAGGVPTKYHDLIQVMTPKPEHTGGAELQLARYTDVFLDDQYEDGADGTVFEYELVYQLNATDTGTPEGNKIPAPDSVVGTNLRDLGSNKEAYRWTMLIKNNEDKDDYQRIMQFCKVMPLTGTNFFAQFTNIVDLTAWFRGIAVNALSGAGDSYGGDGSAHNVQFYVRPDQKVIYFPHDVDAFFDASRSIVPNSELDKVLAVPAYARAYYGAVQEIIATTYNSTYLGRWATQFGRLLPAQPFSSHLAFIVQRVNIVNGQINAAVPNVAFAVTNNSGNAFGTTNDTVTLQGTAPLSVREIEINGVRYPITWVTRTVWSLRVPLYNGPNDLAIQGIDYAGRPLPTAVDSITVTNSGAGTPLPVVINEWMADNTGTNGYPDPLDGSFQDWFELFNPNTNAVNLSGFYLTDNLSIPNKWAVPQGTVIGPGGFLLVWADNQPEQNALDPSGHLHAAFQLNNDGEAIGLFTPGGVAQHIVVFDRQFENVSAGLFPDGDTNAVYFMTNFTPRAANTLTDQLRITNLSLEGNEATLTWQAIRGRNYRIEFRNDLSNPTWTPLDPIVVALGPIATFTDVPVPLTRRFYRVRLLD